MASVPIDQMVQKPGLVRRTLDKCTRRSFVMKLKGESEKIRELADEYFQEMKSPRLLKTLCEIELHDLRNSLGNTLLHVAIERDLEIAVLPLAVRKVLWNVSNNASQTPLHILCAKKIEKRLPGEEEIEPQKHFDRNSRTPFHLLCEKASSKSLLILRDLIKSVPQTVTWLYATDCHGKTPFEYLEGRVLNQARHIFTRSEVGLEVNSWFKVSCLGDGKPQ